jgi:5'-deoxynucleotidase YfbR-like HD superfamily hydrolase
MMAKDGHKPNTVLAGLLHDASEYVFGDVNYHLKRLPELAEYNRREHECSKMIVAHFGSTSYELEKVKTYDRQAAYLEMAVRDGKSFEIVPHAPKAIYHRFLLKFGELTGNDSYDYSTSSLPPSP